MSYSGTVFCSYCSQKGHNRRGCPKLKKYIAENPTSYYALKQKQKAATERRCSYCREGGHTRRTCTVIVSDRVTLTAQLAAQRKDCLALMVEHGVGVGALLLARRAYWNNDGREAAMVYQIEWRTANHKEDIRLKLRFLSDHQARHQTFCGALGSVSGQRALSPLSAAEVYAGAPSAWLDGSLYDEESYFPKGAERRKWQFTDGD